MEGRQTSSLENFHRVYILALEAPKKVDDRATFPKRRRAPIRGASSGADGSTSGAQMRAPVYGLINRTESHPGVVIINAGEEIRGKILSYFRHVEIPECSQGHSFRSLIVSATGAVYSPTFIPQGLVLVPNKECEILGLTAQYERTRDGFSRETNPVKINVANPSGDITAGFVSGPLVAATGIQVVVLINVDDNLDEQEKRLPNHPVN